MTVEQAKAKVLAVYPQAHVITGRTTSSLEKRYTVVDGTRWRGRWLSGEHKTEDAAWLKAAKTAASQEEG
jgi:hypothetical protein